MPKFFVPRTNVTDTSIVIDNEDVSHITKVLRLKCGDVIDVCDGQGVDYEARIAEIEKKRVLCDIVSKKKSDTEPNISVTLFQGLPKASKMEYIIQKTTELGISRIVPCVMSRCVVKLSDGVDKKVERWRKVAQEAAKQSGRGIVPEVTMPMTFEEAVAEMKKCDVAFAPYECESVNTLKSVLTGRQNPETVGFMVGPEGGYDLSEVEMLKGEGIGTVTLGKRILRTETAGEAVLSMTMYEIGDVNIIESV